MENLENQQDQFDQQQDQFEQPQASSWSTAVNYGLIGGVALSILSVITFLLDLDEVAGWLGTVLSIVVFIVFVIWAIKSHRDQKLGGTISFGKAFGVGFLTVLIMGLIGAIFSFIYLQFIDPSVLAEAEREMEREMAKQDMSREDMEQALSISKMFVTPVAISVMGFVMNLIFGAVISLIGAAIYQREN